jgi:hypothetical protein
MRERGELEIMQRRAHADDDYYQTDLCSAQMDILVQATHLLVAEEKQIATIY